MRSLRNEVEFSMVALKWRLQIDTAAFVELQATCTNVDVQVMYAVVSGWKTLARKSYPIRAKHFHCYAVQHSRRLLQYLIDAEFYASKSDRLLQRMHACHASGSRPVAKVRTASAGAEGSRNPACMASSFQCILTFGSPFELRGHKGTPRKTCPHTYGPRNCKIWI